MKENYQLLLKSFRNFLRIVSGQNHPPTGYSDYLKAVPAFSIAPYQQRNKSMLNVFSVLVFGLLFTVNATAQVSSYGFSAGTSGTLNAMASSTQLVGSGSDDGASTVTNIGFTFNYAGTNYTQFSANANGLMRLGGTAVSASSTGYTNTAANANSNTPAIMAYWDDLATGAAAGGGKVHYITTGTAPNRSLIVEWFVTVPRATGGNANARIQCKLDETTNVITLTYGAVAANSTGYSIGLSTSTSVYNSVTTSSNTNSNSAFMTTNTGAIASGRTYTFTPPLPCTTPDAATNVVFTNTTANATTVSWSAAATNASNGYTVFRSTSATPPTVTNGTAYTAGTFYATNYLCVYDGAATTTTVSNLTPNTNYYYYVFARNNACTGTPFYAPVVSASKPTAISDPIMTGVANLSDTNATIVWVAADTGSGYDTNAPKYTLEYADNAAFTGATAITGLTASTYDLVLTPAATYYVRVTGVGTLTSNPTSVINFIAKKDEWTPFTITAASFNHDVILDGKKGGTGMATTGIDGANWCYYESGYSINEWTSLPTTGNGLPNNHLYTSSSKNYFIGSYKTNNALRLLGTASSPNNGVLELTNPTAVTSLDIIATSGDAASSFTVTLTFTDGTSAPASGTLTINDWGSSTNAIMSGVRRIKIDNTSEGGTFYIGYVNVAVPAAYQGKILKYVTINRTEGGNGKVSILGVTGKTTPDCITPSTLTTANITDSSVTLNWAALAETPANGYEYYYSTTNTAPAYAATVNAANVVTTNSAAVSLPAMGTYYWWVRSVCGAASTSNWASGGSFITSCTTPAVATDAITSNTAATSLTVSWTAPATTPTGYFVVRSTTPTLSATPVTGTTYAAGASFGGGTVAYFGTATTFNATSLNSNTNYYFTIYSYNGGSTCNGPAYSATSIAVNKATCVSDPLIVGASNVTDSAANLNWSSSTGGGSTAVSYDVEVSADNFATILASGNVATGLQFPVSGLSANVTYTWRVKVLSDGCTTGNWVTANGSFVATNTFTPLDVTGYNYDVIANGVGSALSSTTNAVDDSGTNLLGGYSYMSNDFKPLATDAAITYALPINRVLTSPVAALSGLKFYLGDYAANNSLRLAPSQTGNLSLITPVKLTDIYLAVTGGSGTPSVNVTVTFIDENNVVSTQAPVSVSFTDWYQTNVNTPTLIQNIGRANRTANTRDTGAAKIFQVAIPILAANQGKKVTNVTLTSGTAGGYANMFAISGKIIGSCPTMASTSAVATGSAQADVSWVLGNPGGAPLSAVTYKLEVFANADFTGLVGAAYTGITATTQPVAGLTANTTYYYKVTAGNGYCDSGFVSGSFTTLLAECLTPDAPTFAITATGSTSVTGTVTAPATAPTGFIVIRSTSATLSAAPANFTTYTAGATVGDGKVIYVGTSTAINDATAASNTLYYYYIYSYNSGGTCAGPVYSTTGATASTTTCVAQSFVVGASNIKNSSATLNWTSVSGGGATAVTYNLDVYTDAAYTTSFASYTGLTGTKQAIEGLTANAVYYYKVQSVSSGSCSATPSTGSFLATNGFTPIDVTSGGYNQDVIANGSGAAQYSTTEAVDATGAGNAYVALNYVDGNGVATTAGLPINRFLASTSTSGLNFIIPDYSGNNSLRLPAQDDTGTLTFETPVKLTDLYIATTGGSGGLTASAEIIFSDGGTSQITTGIAIPDWVTGTGSVIVNNLGRASRINTTGGFETLASKIFQVAIPIAPANQTRKVASVKFTKTSTGVTEPVLNIFAISGKIIGDCPTMASTAANTVTATGADISWVLSTEGDGGAPTYTVEVYTDAAFTTAAITPVTGVTGTTTTVAGLNAQTTYYYRVKAINAVCESGYVTGSFTTSQIPATLNLAEGFEGTNGWAFVNGSQTNKWFVGTATNNGGTKSLYISDDAAGATYNYNIGILNVVQAYRDIAVPAGTGNVEFSFDWKADGESTYDYLRVWLVPASYIPVAGTQIAAGTGLIQIGGNFNQQSAYNTYSTPTLDLSSFAGQTMRLVFEWRNDGSLGTQPPASIDNVSIVIPTCPGPTAVTATGGFSTGSISWTAPSSAPAGGYDYYYSTTNTAPSAAVAGTNTAGSPVNLTGLTSSLTYYVWVRSHCSDSDKGTWVSGGSFYTGYCTPTYTQACDTGHRISAISVPLAASFSTTMASGCTHDYTTTQIAVTAGNTYAFNVTVTGYTGLGMVADFNNDGDFIDAGEVIGLPLYLEAGAVGDYTHTVSVTIPSTATSGLHRIRFWNRLANGGNGDSPCGSYNYGTYVDYTLNITVPCFDWTGTVDNSWTNTANWCGGVLPNATADITIAASSHNPFINSGVVYVNSLVVEEGAILTVNTGATLNVATTITSSEIAPNIIVNNNGAIVQGNSSTANDNTGDIVFHKFANPLYRLDYTLWSSPITGQTLRNFSLGTSNNRFYTYGYQVAEGQTAYDEAYWPVNPITTYFAEGKGYLIRMPNTITANVTGADENGNATTTTPALYVAGTGNYIYDGAFTGKANNGPYNPALIQLPGTVTEGSETYGYYNAVGNPYPSPISVSDFLTANSGNLAGSTGIWLWRKKNASETSYLTLNLSGLVTPPTDTNGNGTLDDTLSGFYEGTPNTSWVIAPGQGFIVQAQPTATSVSFANSMRRATPGATQAFFRQAANTASRYWLNMTAQNGSGSQALVAYSENGTTGIDFGYDSKVFGGETSLSLYSVVTDNKLAIQARPEFEVSDIVPMGFTAPTAGQYTISIDHNDGVFADGQAIYLKDLQEGVIRNLSLNNYTFTSEAGTFEGRFEVHYQTSALGTDNPVLDANSVVVFKQGNAISINTGNAMMNSVKVFDVRGRQLYSQGGINATETVISNLNVQQQVLIVEIATEKGTVSKRIVF